MKNIEISFANKKGDIIGEPFKVEFKEGYRYVWSVDFGEIPPERKLIEEFLDGLREHICKKDINHIISPYPIAITEIKI